MSAGPIPLRYVEETDERRGDRRAMDRRAPRRRCDPLFAATLVNQIAPAERVVSQGYMKAAPRVRAGIAFDFKA